MFIPCEHGLDDDFRLTSYSTLRGWGCKVPQDVLNRLLVDVNLEGMDKKNDTDHVGIGMDSAVIPLKNHPELSLVQTVDFFYPLINDPYIMGRIALANVVSDIYSVGVIEIDKIAMILSSSTSFTDLEREVVMPMIIRGFKDAAKEAGCEVKVQNIAENSWCIIGNTIDIIF